uniref:Protein Nef n=1 Tax=Human immunodeficiency virus type 1 TaxID=11676 RepID=A0A0B5GMB1_HV1|nr:nef protein [Human immunodeficiency virus 1]
MGGKWSKRSAPGWNTIRERMRRTEPGRTEPAAEGVGAVSRDLERHGAITTSTTPSADGDWLEAQEEEEEELPFPPQPPLTSMTYTEAVDFNLIHLEKEGLERLSLTHSKRDLHVLEVYVYHRYCHDCDSYTYRPGPRIPLPLTWGCSFKPVQLEQEEEENATEKNNLFQLQPMNVLDEHDPEGQMWKFNFHLPLPLLHLAKHKHHYYDCDC